MYNKVKFHLNKNSILSIHLRRWISDAINDSFVSIDQLDENLFALYSKSQERVDRAKENLEKEHIVNFLSNEDNIYIFELA